MTTVSGVPASWVKHDVTLTFSAADRGSGVASSIYLPYGTDWYGYFMRRLAERPANVTFFLRALAG